MLDPCPTHPRPPTDGAQRERMLAGDPYQADEPELVAAHLRG